MTITGSIITQDGTLEMGPRALQVLGKHSVNEL